MATAYGQRPSQLLKITHSLAAFEFDNAVMYFGRYIEAKASERDAKTHKPIYRLDDLLTDPKKRDKKQGLAQLAKLRGVSMRRVANKPE